MSQIKIRYIGHLGSDLTVVNAARISYDTEKEELDEKDKKLIHYLGFFALFINFGRYKKLSASI